MDIYKDCIYYMSNNIHLNILDYTWIKWINMPSAVLNQMKKIAMK